MHPGLQLNFLGHIFGVGPISNKIIDASANTAHVPIHESTEAILTACQGQFNQHVISKGFQFQINCRPCHLNPEILWSWPLFAASRTISPNKGQRRALLIGEDCDQPRKRERSSNPLRAARPEIPGRGLGQNRHRFVPSISWLTSSNASSAGLSMPRSELLRSSLHRFVWPRCFG